ncbi:MAG TPA: DUF2313 domain-containing protein [Candidatus Fimivicinus intestinavium]|nr:DUF2313 domain-containing protein [Candidatus Fimivicinus intestinavium]
MNLLEKMPEYYRVSKEVCGIEAAFGKAADNALSALEELMAQCFVNTADWALPLWEKSVGVAPEEGKDIIYRRTRILSKLRGGGTSTKEMLKNTIESFYNGEVDILEYPTEYRFEVKFLSTIGIPPNLSDVTQAIEEAKPAHLAYSYIITFVLQEELMQFTHSQLAGKSHEQIRNEAVTNDGNRVFAPSETRPR